MGVILAGVNFDLGIGDLLSTGLNFWQNQENMKFSKAEAERQEKQYQQSFQESVRQYEENMAWQKYLASNSYQLKTADLKAAGINPILAAGGGTVSAPPISTVHGGNSAPVSAPSHSRYDVRADVSRNALLDLQRKVMDTEVRRGEAGIANIEADSDLKHAQADSYRADVGFKGNADVRATAAESRAAELHKYNVTQARNNNNISSAEFSHIQLNNIKSQHEIDRFDIADAIQRQDLTLKRLQGEDFEYKFRRAGIDMSVEQIKKTILQYELDIYTKTGYSVHDSSDAAQVSRWVNATYPNLSQDEQRKMAGFIASVGTLLERGTEAYGRVFRKKMW